MRATLDSARIEAESAGPFPKSYLIVRLRAFVVSGRDRSFMVPFTAIMARYPECGLNRI
jgi:hypothetical protein